MTHTDQRVVRRLPLAALVAAALLAAGIGPIDAAAQAAAAADPIEGVWEFVVTRRDCASGAALGTQKAFSLFHRGGTLSNDNATPPGTHGAMFGVWKRLGSGRYAARMVFMRIHPDGTLAGTQRVDRDLAPGADPHTLAGSVVAQTIDATGATVQRGCATEAGVRVF